MSKTSILYGGGNFYLPPTIEVTDLLGERGFQASFVGEYVEEDPQHSEWDSWDD